MSNRASIFAQLILINAAFTQEGVAQETGSKERPGVQSGSVGLVVETSAERRIVKSSIDGAHVEFIAAEQLHAGDEIFYTLRVRNESNVSIADPVVIKAIPRNTLYAAESAIGPAVAVTLSTDGGATFSDADELEVVTLPGVTQEATPKDYTHIRWQMRHALAPGATALLRFRGTFK